MQASPLVRLWQDALQALSRLRSALVPLDTLLVKERRALRTHLRALEAFCRRVALTEALTLLDRGMSSSAEARRAKAEGPPARLNTRAPRKAHKRQHCLRLWPREKPMPVRIRLLGRPTSMRELWREQKRAALAARLAQARRACKPAHLRLADRIDALQRLLDGPRAALRRLARKLRVAPKLAYLIAARRAPPSSYLAEDIVRECEGLCWAAVHDSS